MNGVSTVWVAVVVLVVGRRGSSQGLSASLGKDLRLGVRDRGNLFCEGTRSGPADNRAAGGKNVGSGAILGEGASGKGRNGGSSSKESDESKGNFGGHVDDINWK